jgi:hypothetical protein
MSRYVYFALAILAGIGLGLLYGWVISPVEFVDTSPNMLREDYKADYVLMVAEVYSNEDDLQLAVQRLGLLGGDDIPANVEQALVFAVDQGYTADDLALMRTLYEAVQTWNPALEPAGQ